MDVPPQGLSATSKFLLAAEVVRNYVRVRRAMFRSDLPTTLERIRRPAARAGRQPLHPEAGARLARAVRRTLAVLPADSKCLMQSLVLTAMLARRGIVATVVIGVRHGESFVAHAWVELDGHPLLPTFSDKFSRLVDL